MKYKKMLLVFPLVVLLSHIYLMVSNEMTEMFYLYHNIANIISGVIILGSMYFYEKL